MKKPDIELPKHVLTTEYLVGLNVTRRLLSGVVRTRAVEAAVREATELPPSPARSPSRSTPPPTPRTAEESPLAELDGVIAELRAQLRAKQKAEGRTKDVASDGSAGDSTEKSKKKRK